MGLACLADAHKLWLIFVCGFILQFKLYINVVVIANIICYQCIICLPAKTNSIYTQPQCRQSEASSKTIFQWTLYMAMGLVHIIPHSPQAPSTSAFCPQQTWFVCFIIDASFSASQSRNLFRFRFRVSIQIKLCDKSHAISMRGCALTRSKHNKKNQEPYTRICNSCVAPLMPEFTSSATCHEYLFDFVVWFAKRYGVWFPVCIKMPCADT